MTTKPTGSKRTHKQFDGNFIIFMDVTFMDIQFSLQRAWNKEVLLETSILHAASWNFQSLNKKIQKDQLKDDSQKLFYLVTYAFSSKRWNFTGKIQLISKLMTRFLMFVRKKEGIREFIFLTSLLSLSFLHTVTSMIWNVTPMTDFVIR